MKRFVSGVLLLCLLACALIGASTYNDPGSRHWFWVGVVPTSATTIVGGTVYLRHVSVGKGSSTGTLTISDRGTDCAGSPCDFATAIAIAANTTYEMDFNDAIAPSGLNIVATGTVSAHIHWVTQVQP